MRRSMRVADATNKNRIERLHRFFEAMHALSDQAASENKNRSSLKHFFAEFAQFKSIIAAKPEQKTIIESQVSPVRFNEFIEHFGPLSQQLRKAGEFIDVWEISGLKRIELRNASVLAWLFNPNQTHGRGSAIFQTFIRRLAELHQEQFPLPMEFIGSYSAFTETYPLGNVENRVDIALNGTDFFVFIEVKIDAPEGDGQLDKYRELAKEKADSLGTDKYAVIYLSPKRLQAPLNVIAATWNDVAGAIQDVAVSDSFGDRILLQFASYIRQF